MKADDYKRACMEWERYDLETRVGLAEQRMKEKQMNKQHLPDETKEVEEDHPENVSRRHLCERAGNSVAFLCHPLAWHASDLPDAILQHKQQMIIWLQKCLEKVNLIGTIHFMTD